MFLNPEDASLEETTDSTQRIIVLTEAIAAQGIKTFGPLLTKLATQHAARMLDNDPERLKKIKTDIEPHVEATFKRCSSIKTLLNPLTPANFLSIYATQRFALQGKVIDHYDLVDYIRSDQNNVIVTGTGGSGKSMFMRYLWLSLFEHGDGRIPLFVELKHINSLSKPDLEQYLFQTLHLGTSSITQKDFQKKLEAGDFIVILDGFDELSLDRIEKIQSDIMILSENHHKLKIVVSGRPDNEFGSWTSFHVVKVTPMLKKDVLELIKKAEFDSVPKDKFYKKVRTGGLYEKHPTFLSNPLLASMMLLTFSYNYDIPDKMHLFYRQAFDALYQRHDSHKPGGFKREFHTKLSEDEFKRLLSYFCLITYYDEKFEFDRDEAVTYIGKAISIEDSSASPENFLKDLDKCVCILVPDGIKYTFPHRSFQEYFAAYCMAHVTSKNFEAVVAKFAKRPNDEVVPLLADMNPELFREKYVIPAADRFTDELQSNKKTKSLPKHLDNLKGTFVVLPKMDDDSRVIYLTESGEFHEFCALVSKLCTTNDKARWAKRQKDDDAALLKISELLKAMPDDRLAITSNGRNFVFAVSRSGEVQTPVTSPELEAAFATSGMHDHLAHSIKEINAYISNARRDSGHTSNAMKDIFDL